MKGRVPNLLMSMRDFVSWLDFPRDVPQQPLNAASVVEHPAGLGQADGLSRVVRVKFHGDSRLELRNVILTSRGTPLASDCGLDVRVLFNAANKPASVAAQKLFFRDDDAYRRDGGTGGGLWVGTIFDTTEIAPETGLKTSDIRAVCEMFARAVRNETPIGSAENPFSLNPAPSAFAVPIQGVQEKPRGLRICRG